MVESGGLVFVRKMKPRININTLAVDDIEKSLAFYRDGLGLPTEGLTEGADQVLYELEGNLYLVLNLRSELEEINQSFDGERTSQVILSYSAESKEEIDLIL